jgi:hypothetical protein
MINGYWSSVPLNVFAREGISYFKPDPKDRWGGRYEQSKIEDDEREWLANWWVDQIPLNEQICFVIGPREPGFDKFLNNNVVKERMILEYESPFFHALPHPERETDQSKLYVFKRIK